MQKVDYQIDLCARMLTHAAFSEHTGSLRPSEVIQKLMEFFPADVIQSARAKVIAGEIPIDPAKSIPSTQETCCGDDCEVLKPDETFGEERLLLWPPNGYELLHYYDTLKHGDLMAPITWHGPVQDGDPFVGTEVGPSCLACRPKSK